MGASQWTLGDKHGLISNTRDTGNGHYVIARTYPTGDVELTAVRLTHEDQFRRSTKGKQRRNSEKAAMSATDLQKSQRRARQKVRRLVLSHAADTLLTLTFRENVTDLDRAWGIFKYFTKLMRWKYREFAYVAVPELQDRGAVHFHLAVRGYFHWNTVRALWRRAAGDSQGNVDFQTHKTKYGKVIKNPKKIAGYMAKYMTKTDIVGINKRRYSTGGDIQIPLPEFGWLAIGGNYVHILCQLIKKLTRKPVMVIYSATERYPMLYLST